MGEAKAKPIGTMRRGLDSRAGIIACTVAWPRWTPTNETDRAKDRTSRLSVAAGGRHAGVCLGAVPVLWRRSLGGRRGGAFRTGPSQAAAIDAGQTKPRGRIHRSDHYLHGHPAAGDDRSFAGAGSVKPCHENPIGRV